MQESTSKLERIMMQALTKRGISFTHEFRYKIGVADFFISPDIVVFVDGEYCITIHITLRKVLYNQNG